MTENYGMTRRDFAKMLGCAAVLGLVDVNSTTPATACAT